MFHGNGHYYFAESGKTYKGQFQENVIVGTGTMMFPDGTRYDGDFKDGMMHGHGILWSPNGDRYQGNFEEDLKEGTGVWHDIANQTKRQGEWSKGKRVSWITSATQQYVTLIEDKDNYMQEIKKGASND